MRTFLRWWETLGRPERIVAMSLTAGSIVAVANSLTWAVAACYMTRQKAQVSMWQATRNLSTAQSVEGASAGSVGGTEAHAAPNHRADVSLPLA
ncbi:MAG TPA: hypothetical protein VKT52_11240 [Ktedonobacterales bacterium]|nr:hypothetical protein [Ktedonobacterales bacterium]